MAYKSKDLKGEQAYRIWWRLAQYLVFGNKDAPTDRARVKKPIYRKPAIWVPSYSRIIRNISVEQR